MPYSLALRLILLGSTYLIPGNIWLHLQRNDRLPMNSELRANQIPLHVQRWLPGCWEETTISYCACDNIRKPGEVPCCLFVHNVLHLTNSSRTGKGISNVYDILFLCGTQKETFSRMFALLFSKHDKTCFVCYIPSLLRSHGYIVSKLRTTWVL